MTNIFHKTILLLIISFCASFLYANTSKEYEIDKRIVLQEGLSQSRIQAIIEDERGFMWFGTADGLNRYDGYSFKIFRNNHNDSTSIHDNSINSMVEDSTGNIWIGTNNGISVFNPYTEIFESITSNSIKGNNSISTCVIDKQNNIWYTVSGDGIFKINPATHISKRIFLNTDDSLFLKDVNNIFIDNNNILWIGNYLHGGIYAYNINKDTLYKYHLSGLPDILNKKIKINSFYEDDANRIWASLIDYDGLDGSLYFLDKEKNTFISYNQFLTKQYKDSNFDRLNTIVSITGDKNEIWFASLLGGIFKFEFGKTPTSYYASSPITEASINCIYKSKNGILWIGTNGNGIEISVPNNANFSVMNNSTNANFTITSIRAFAEDSEYYWVGGYYGLSKIKKDFSEVIISKPQSVYALYNSYNNNNVLWTGSEGGGFQPLIKSTNTFQKLKVNSTYPIRDIFIIYQLNDTMLLLGTQNGLFSYNPLSKLITKYPVYCKIKNREIKKTVRTIYEDKHGNVLIGFTQGGVGKLNLTLKRIEKFDVIPQLDSENNYNPINCIYHDDEDRYWIATNNGLIMYNVKTEDYKLITENDGLPNSHIYGILPDEENNIWMSTNNGLSCYSPYNDKFRNYDISDGLQNNEFNTGAYFKASDNTLFFGGINGFNYFNPKQIRQNIIVPKIIITDIKISNKSIHFDKQKTNSNELTIKPSDDSFSIEFAGLSFINSNKNNYKYRLKELNKKWIDIGTSHTIRFNSIDPGTHTLEILASNNHGLWLKKPFSFKIIRVPSFFESALFKWIISVLVIIVVFIGYKIRLKRIINQKIKLQKLVDQKTKDIQISNNTLKDEIIKHKETSKELKASNVTKDKFLSIMAHDIINPLGVIVGFSDLLVNQENSFSKEDETYFIKTINSTSKGLTSLLSNLLQWSRLQSGTISPKPISINVNKSITDTVTLLHGNIIEKQINLEINVDDKIKVFTDANMLLTIFRNLLSNAIKFTPTKGSISINTVNNNNMVEICIKDTGVGIPKKNIALLFKTNNGISKKGTNNEAGTGLGLGLVHEFIVLNGGKIWVKSEEGLGSEFSFSLPVG